MRACRAFTLIELLVVVSIIALLIGFLLPALGAARRSAMTVTCGTQIKQMGSAQFAHAAGHNGHFVHGAPSQPGLSGAVSAWTIWQAGGPAQTRGWIGVGALWRMGYLDGLRVAYCPLWTAPRFQYGDRTYGFAPDPAAAPGHGGQVAWTYHYRSAMDADDGNARPAQLEEDDVGDPFLSDAFTAVPPAAFGPGATTGPAKQFAHGDGYNVGYLDGSVIYLVDRNDVVAQSAPDGAEHEDAESDVWEPYFERQSDYFLGGPNAGTIGQADPDE